MAGRKLRLIIGGAVLALGLTGCSKATEPFKDAGVSGRNDDPARVITFPDGFSNAAGKCDGPNMVYTAFKGDDNRSAVAVAPNDPRCRG